jgi:diaminopimelate epimerase
VDVPGFTFYKMTGSGNDFVFLDGRANDSSTWSGDRIVELCDRRFGVGADGLVFLTPAGTGQVRMAFFNCDGSRAAMCGNAALCSTRLAADLGLAPPAGMELVTDAGTFPSRCLGTGEEAELNLPPFDIPVPVLGIASRPEEQAITVCTVGVPHLTVVTAALDSPDLMSRGRELRYHRAVMPEGANVNFVDATPESGTGIWPMRTYERGVEGETLACGTGAVAVGVTLALTVQSQLPVLIRTRSGRILRVTARITGNRVEDVWLGGEGKLVFCGEWSHRQ